MRKINLFLLIFLSFFVGSFCDDNFDPQNFIGKRVRICGEYSQDDCFGRLGTVCDVDLFDAFGQEYEVWCVQPDGWDREEWFQHCDVVLVEEQQIQEYVLGN
ncbi:hypothetical protein HN511_04005 [bacterium]|jgi:hypothetical protein|nr:hypothetical protein [bacterium]